MINLVEQLLDVTRIDTNTFGFTCTDINLHEFLSAFLLKFDVLTAHSGCVIDQKGDQNTVLYWDRTRLEQVLTNLINNAIKYAAKAPIVVTWEAYAHHTIIQVIDHGKGIAPKDRKRIFQKSSRLNEHGATDAPSGLGLGLWITHQIVTTAGGSLTVDEADAGESVFSVIIPKSAETKPTGFVVDNMKVLDDLSGQGGALCALTL